jgi:hypothetical protein
MKYIFFILWLSVLTPVATVFATDQPETVTVIVSTNRSVEVLSPQFLGLSYETGMLLPVRGRYYFDANDSVLVNLFKTLGVKSLRIGGNTVDDERISIPQEKDIDSLFNFARSAGVKVIYSFRLHKGDPAESARLATYITTHYADVLDCFSIGNEPDLYKPRPTYETFFPQWKTNYDAILKAVPQAMFDGPSAVGHSRDNFTLRLVKDMFADRHLAMASDHYYFLGSGRAGETNPPATRARFLSNNLHAIYEKDYAQVGAVLAAQNVPYRIDEMNSCYNGGAKNSSDTYASTLWALDCTHWWAAHHILGVNYHTGESVGRDGGFGAANYAAFVHSPDGQRFVMRPQAYALLAFTQGARGEPLPVKTEMSPAFDFDAYAYRDESGSFYVTFINKSYGEKARPAVVSLQLSGKTSSGKWQRLDLAQKDQDVAAKNGITLGDFPIDGKGKWQGRWIDVVGGKFKHVSVRVAPASAVILHFIPEK